VKRADRLRCAVHAELRKGSTMGVVRRGLVLAVERREGIREILRRRQLH